jgi:hypothetical protein
MAFAYLRPSASQKGRFGKVIPRKGSYWDQPLYTLDLNPVDARGHGPGSASDRHEDAGEERRFFSGAGVVFVSSLLPELPSFCTRRSVRT